MSSSIGFPSDGVDHQGWKLYIASLVMVLAAGIFVIARCIERIRSRQMGADDYTILLSMAFSIFLSVAIQTAVTHGYGKHKADLSENSLRAAMKWWYISQTPYKLVVSLNKISVVLFYKRIFITRNFQLTCWLTLAIVAAWCLGTVLSTILQCIPIPGTWDKSIPAQCIDHDSFWIGYAVSNVLTDALVLAIPIPEILKLHLSLRQRLGLCGIFLLSGMYGFIIICGVLRTTSVSNSLSNKLDATYTFIPRGIWTLIEANVGIICACLPILWHAFSTCVSRTVGVTFGLSGAKILRPDRLDQVERQTVCEGRDEREMKSEEYDGKEAG